MVPPLWWPGHPNFALNHLLNSLPLLGQNLLLLTPWIGSTMMATTSVAMSGGRLAHIRSGTKTLCDPIPNRIAGRAKEKQNRFAARIKRDGKFIYLGSFVTGR